MDEQLSSRPEGVLIVDLICYGAVYTLMFFALRPFVKTGRTILTTS